MAGLFVVGSVLLTVAWCAPAQADGSSGLGYKIVGASYTQELRFANCMRDHGEPGFPDPNSDGVFYSNRIDTNSPEYQAAQKACQNLLPKSKPLSPAEQAKLQERALAFANCMRRHGEPNFPDPSSGGGGISFSLRGVDPSSPQFQAAQKVCQNLSPVPGGAPGPP